MRRRQPEVHLTLDALLHAAESADGLTRIEYRDPIAAHGAVAIERLRPWLLDSRLGRFAVRAIEAAARQPCCAEVARTALHRARDHAPQDVRQDIIRALAALPRARESTSPVVSSGSPERALAQLRAVVTEWRRRGQPAQPAIDWPRERWLAALPEHAAVLRSLPRHLDRAAVAAMGRHARASDSSAIDALVSAMAWGHGRTGYAQFRARNILAQPDVGRRLRLVAEAVEMRGALAGYKGLADDNRVEGLGPSFGTKFLYFVQAPDARPRALIHDRVMSNWLMAAAGLSLRSEPYSIHRYDAYLRQMHAWASELDCEPDQVEAAIFRAVQPPGSQWA